MTAVASTAVGREAGHGLLTLANLITAVAPVAADWNDSHIFNRRWPSHARFHGVVALTMTSTLAGLNLRSLWSPSTDRTTSRLFAAAVPVGYWPPWEGGLGGRSGWGWDTTCPTSCRWSRHEPNRSVMSGSKRPMVALWLPLRVTVAGRAVRSP